MKTYIRWCLMTEQNFLTGGKAESAEKAGECAGDWARKNLNPSLAVDLIVEEVTETLLTKARLQGGKITVSHLPINSRK